MAVDPKIELLPRLSGRVLTLAEGKFTYEFFVGFLWHDEADHYTSKETFNTHDEAKSKLMEVVEFISKTLAKEFGADGEEYIDLKTNTTKRWKDKMQ
jgi:hypothetical protein